MLRLFASNQTLVIILLPILLTVNVVLNNYFDLFEVWRGFQTNLWGLKFLGLNPILSSFFAICLITITATILNFTFNQHEFYERNTFLPSFFYVLLVMFFPFSTMLNGDLFAHFFLAISVNQFLKIKQNEDARSHVFNSAFFLGICTTFNPVYIGFLPFFWIGLSSVRPFQLREYLMVGLGCLIPLLWLSILNINFIDVIFKEMAINETMLSKSYFSITVHILTLVLFLIALRFIFERFTKSSIRFKRLFRMMLLLLIYPIATGIILYYVLGTDYFLSIGLTLLPILLVYAYLDAKVKTVPTILVYLLLVLNVVKFFV